MGRKTIMNQNAPSDIVAQINPKNTELLNEFMDYLKATGRSPKTIDAYKVDIVGSFAWCVNHNDNRCFLDWTKRQIVKFQNYMIQDLHNSPARVKRVKASLSSMANFIENVMDEEYPDFRNKIRSVESPVLEPVRKKTVLTDEQMDRILREYTAEGRHDRACMIALALYSGRRKSELVRFRVSDFGEDHLVCNGALYKSDPIKTKGRGANGKQLECFTLAQQFKPYLNEWLHYREVHGIESEWLFPNPNNPEEHMNAETLNSWAKSISAKLDIDFYWHSIRHKTVTTFKRAGIPDTVIQQYIGWSDISMVPVYTDMDAQEQLGMYFDGSVAEGYMTPDKKDFSDI